MEKKKNLIILGVVLGIFLLIGATYAFFTYYRESDKVNELIAGEVYMKFVDGENTIGLINTFPETVEEARLREDNVITFTIDGKNTTTNKDVYYEIKLLYADDIQGKTRFLDKHLKFDLVETTNGVSEMVLSAVSYNEINNKRIWVNTVLRNTTEEIARTYQLRMWLSGDILISDTEDNADYTTNEFKNSYANVKVAVYGDFVYKEVAQDASCFAYNTVSNSISYNNLHYDLNTSSESVAVCKDYLLNGGGDISDAQDGYQSYCNGSGTVSGHTFKEYIENEAFTEEDMTYFIDNNVLVQNDNPTITGIEITNYAVDTCGTDVAIPSYIDGYPVIGIAGERDGTPAMYLSSYDKLDNNRLPYNNLDSYEIKPIISIAEGVFGDMEITSVHFPETLRYIGKNNGDGAFEANNLTNIIIPSSVTYIAPYSFLNNPMVNVYVKGAAVLGRSSFVVDASDEENHRFEVFQYGGTCEQLNSGEDSAFNDYVENGRPYIFITSDNSSCEYTLKESK